ncbi:3-hydroxyacyl-ACP dehydratase FabZ [Sphingorhabdus soli]|uniref:3-hydroxyacyl-[acyl-carrier-protein] dehydratase FabZ n=1 Tax=Flavisphingopyxis soli TaxID=2601267 RepID=A0A5C6UAV5_9SPHN|nr:3-hydroxyacyl-ACP dehydratase FabZ [Sphingorhabdus soli]TXC68818.1 3-hydroxyacyl-ACP dehydratase FabZ [Sphingorhabdus soli]
MTSSTDGTDGNGATANTIDIGGILALLPHRYPLLLVDRVVSYETDTSIHAVKGVTMNEQFFQGHFPGRPIMPGVLQIEALAQAAGVLAMQSLREKDPESGSGKLVYFMAIENAKFRKPVEPGCLLDLHVDIVQNKGRVCKFKGQAKVDGAVVSECSFTAMIADAPAG